MSKDFLEAILDEAMHECVVAGVALFNWTEPLLHPAIHELIGAVRSRGIHCSISTSLNVLRAPDLLMRANPDWLRVSVSGFTQEIYVRGHKGGDIETVKANMRRPGRRQAPDRRNHRPRALLPQVHRQRSRRSADEGLCRDARLSLRRGLGPHDAAREIPHDRDPCRATREDHATLARLALKMDQAFALTSQRGVTSCSLQDDFIVLDVNGNATLCCASMASKANTIGNYLAMPIEAIQAAWRSHALCKPCMSVGFPLVANYADEARASTRSRCGNGRHLRWNAPRSARITMRHRSLDTSVGARPYRKTGRGAGSGAGFFRDTR